ncbi:family 43 glycoside hydrolase [Fusarium redolens]|uniref:Family 43 glycoside hydrolase n=1 Tax=Fusarium redolens TaxID=48865 RepID=A0A9P9G2X8_FUSRE|nr:family 43 glycoside hydrolase [Fusarium redolens]KAH7231248.1 family 43 glycoside hydrolase [Fusarium redolens]
MPLVTNPILPGFNPDPSILRVKDDYYIATSTFEWYPGVQIHHSKDLVNWNLVCRPLNRASLLDMRGIPDSCGVWAPCLSHDGSKFYLVYTSTRRLHGSFKDTPNYITCADDIQGPWSEPVYVNSSGFDPSLFHDNENCTKWFVNMLWDHRNRPLLFAGICLQQYDPDLGKLVGPRKNIWQGTSLGYVEGPHMYKRNGWYYILAAEGGTGWLHACSMARSRSIWGPYENHPENHILTSKDDPLVALQKAGHGDIVGTPDGRTYLVHLTGRPTGQERRCVLGRETAIQEAYWADDDWLYVKDGPIPSLHVNLLAARDDANYWAEQRYAFESNLPSDFQWLRTPKPNRIFKVDNGLVLYGRESIGSWFEQALVARRQCHFSFDAETVIEFYPEDERQYAGLTAYYNRYSFYYLTVTAHSDGERELLLMKVSAPNKEASLDSHTIEPISIPKQGGVKLAMSVRGDKLRFFYAMEDEELKQMGPVLDASTLSDECAQDWGDSPFTGAFVGMACSDLNGLAREARFDYFVYRPVRDQSDRYGDFKARGRIE